MRKVFELRKNKRVQEIRARLSSTAQVSEEEQINPSQCFHCGALLPADVGFQELHMLKEHGIEV